MGRHDVVSTSTALPDGQFHISDLQHTISLDPLNGFYQHLDDFDSITDYLQFAASRQLLTALGLRLPLSDSSGGSGELSTDQTILALDVDGEIGLSEADRAALVLLHQPETQLFALSQSPDTPRISLHPLEVTHDAAAGMSQLTITVERSGFLDVSSSVLLGVSHAFARDGGRLLQERLPLQVLEFAPGDTTAGLVVDVPVGTVHQLQLQLSHPVQALMVQDRQELDLHAIEMSLSAEHLVNHRSGLSSSSERFQNQGSGTLFYSFTDGLDTDWRSWLVERFSVLEAEAGLRFIEVPADHPLERVKFDASSSSEVSWRSLSRHRTRTQRPWLTSALARASYRSSLRSSTRTSTR